MSLPVITKPTPPRNNEFAVRLAGEVHNLTRCYQCSMCSDGCPLAYVMDYYPNQIIHLVRLGLRDTVLGCSTIWLCASCETCATRCPNDIDITRLMDLLRSESGEKGVNKAGRKYLDFHKAFVNQIKLKGRVDESLLMADFELRSFDFLSPAKFKELAAMAIGMMRRGKVSVPSLKRHSFSDMRGIFRRVFIRNEKEQG